MSKGNAYWRAHIKDATLAFAVLGLLAACGGGGSSRSAVTPNNDAPAAPPSVTFSASSTSVGTDETTVLTWNATGATSCTASGGWSGSRGVSGSETVGPLEGSTTFALSCSGAGGGTLRELLVTVITDDGATVTLTASEPLVLIDGQVELTWTSEGATECEASGAWLGIQPASGSFTTPPLTETSTFKLTCTATGTSAVALVTVDVVDNTIRWTAPTENVDGSTLTDLAGFTVYWGSSSRNYSSSITLGEGAREWTADIGSGQYFFAVTASNAASEESAYSNEIRKVFP